MAFDLGDKIDTKREEIGLVCLSVCYLMSMLSSKSNSEMTFELYLGVINYASLNE